MSRRRTALTSLGIFLGFVVVSLLFRIVTAREERLPQTVRVAGKRSLGANRFLVKVAPQDEAETLPVEAITRYPFGLATVEAGGPGAPSKPAPRAVPVRAARLAPGPVVRRVVAFGTVEASRDARVAVEATGVVEQVRFVLGQAVAAGAPLVELDDKDATHRLRRAEGEQLRAKAGLARAAENVTGLEAQAETARAVLELRAREVERWRDMAKKELASPERVDQADVQWRLAVAEAQRLAATLAQARASLDEAQAAVTLAAVELDAARLGLERCVLRAPFDGAVAERLLQEGQWVQAGTAAARLVSTDRVRVRVHVREEEASGIVAGAQAQLTLPGLQLPATYPDGGAFAAQVEGLARAADPATRTFAVDVVAPAQGPLRPGLFARVVLDGGTVADAVLVPDAAIIADEAGHHVFVVAEPAPGRLVVRRTAVVLGPRQGEARLVRSGLGPGPCEVVVEGVNLLFDGAPITRLGP